MKIRFPFKLKSATPKAHEGIGYNAMSPQQKSKAIERMYHEHHQLLYSIALKLCRSEVAADDLIQDTMFKATKYLHTFDGRNETAWLKQVLRTCFIDTYQRDKKRHAIRGGALEFDDRITQHVTEHDLNGELQELYQELIQDGGEQQWQEVFQHLISDDLLAGLEELSKEHRDILIMSHLMDMPYEEIADLLQVRLGTVMSRLHRARNRLGASVASRSEELARKLAAQSGQRRGTKRGTRSKSSSAVQAGKKTAAQPQKKTTHTHYDGAERGALTDSGVTP